MTNESLITVRDLSLEVAGTGHQVVKGISFDIAPGEIFGIVGESGSGKTLATRALISLLPPAIRVTGGSVTYKGKDVMSMPDRALRRLRGAEIGVVFQEPMTSLNPSMTIGRQLEEGGLSFTRSFRRKSAGPAFSTCSGVSASAIPRARLPPIRTNFPAACASASCLPPSCCSNRRC